MKIIIRIISIFIFSLLFSGCSVIYTTAVDQRNVNTIINDTKIDELVKSLKLSIYLKKH